MKKVVIRLFAFLLVSSLLYATVACKSRPRDCKGRKKTAKTEMGGWL